jgi:lipid A ethanolaminephosphotransferase
MFSHLGRAEFDVDEAGEYANVLDALANAGLDVEWRENNAGCKGACERVPTISYGARPDPALCANSYCYDEIMLRGLEARLQQVTRDTVIVFHQIGSHGPAYSERYPPDFEIFKPACRSRELHHCTAQEIVNAYDNTIAYADHLMARQIELLETFSDRLDGVLIYASDHGESLGEQGVYLHGMPYAFAPAAQKEVPMLVWTSPGYVQRLRISLECLRQRASAPVSHDHLYHTILGAAQTRNAAYDPDLDLTAQCRGRAASTDHE